MSLVKDLVDIDDVLKKRMIRDLHFKKQLPKSKNPRIIQYYNGPEIIPYRIMDNKIYIPYHYGKNILGWERRERTEYKCLDKKGHDIALREEQKKIKKEAIDILNRNGSILLALHVGFGKTILSIDMICTIRLKTLIITHRVILIDQWKTLIKKLCENYSVNHITDFNHDYKEDILIVNVINIPKLGEDFLKTFGLVIVDECHLISTMTFSKSLQYLTPRYLIGLSATPYRNDGMDKIMDIYFGKERIIKQLSIKHVAYKIQTTFEPEVRIMENGKVDWNHILDQQGRNDRRNDMIVEIVKKFPERYFLILCKRKVQVEILYEKIRIFERVTTLFGNDKVYDKDARVVIATINKAGVGFSHDVLNTMILASDVEEYYIQYFGRITRHPDTKPIVFDIVDKNTILKQHFRTRKKVYEDIGGRVEDIKSILPDFTII